LAVADAPQGVSTAPEGGPSRVGVTFGVEQMLQKIEASFGAGTH